MSDTAWSLSIRPVGAEQSSSPNTGKDFIVEVSPDDDVKQLYDQIEGITGLKASQQRLIYRGRLIGSANNVVGTEDTPANNNNESPQVTTTAAATTTAIESPQRSSSDMMKIKDIRGLSDGQTIHLVPKRDETSTTPTPEPRRTEASDNESETDAAVSNSAAPLLAALLGLSGGGGDNNNHEDRRLHRNHRSSRRGGRHHHRLSRDDLDVAAPESVESVRQGMMTLHTLLPHAQALVAATRRDELLLLSPLDANRHFYCGQWIDCLDTVNQWLEATVTEIVEPEELLPGSSDSATTQSNRGATSSPFVDPIVTASDYSGRRKLLLEPCEEGDEGELGGELAGYRRRDNDDGVQLLLVHYNGWPHRWDEWLRSDSDRIRPFRTRTRHPVSSQYASPTPQSIFSESPPTYIRSETDSDERAAMLPELARVMTAVNELLVNAANDATLRSSSTTERTTTSSSRETGHLPWSPVVVGPVAAETLDPRTSEIVPATVVSGPSSCVTAGHRAGYRRELEALAPLLDRLGRTLIDAAPHVSAMARTMREGPSEEIPTELEPVEEHPTSLGGLLSLLSRDRRRQSNASNNVVVASDSASTHESVQTGNASEETTLDPDLSDFAYGVVNTTRGEVRRGPRVGRNPSDDAAELLGAYLAAASLGSLVSGRSGNGDDDGGGLAALLRDRVNGGGIDIHIHAVVTAPGVTPGGIGVTTLDTGGTGLARGLGPLTAHEQAGTLLSSRSSPRASPTRHGLRVTTSPPDDDEDLGIFSDLYGENPDPVDPNGTPSSASSSWSPRSDGASRASLSPTTIRSSSTGIGSHQTTGNRSSPSDGSDRRRSSIFGRLFRRSPTNGGP